MRVLDHFKKKIIFLCREKCRKTPKNIDIHKKDIIIIVNTYLNTYVFLCFYSDLCFFMATCVFYGGLCFFMATCVFFYKDE